MILQLGTCCLRSCVDLHCLEQDNANGADRHSWHPQGVSRIPVYCPSPLLSLQLLFESSIRVRNYATTLNPRCCPALQAT